MDTSIAYTIRAGTAVPVPNAKRAFDLFASALLFALTVPVWLIFLLLIFFEHALRGYPLDPLLYREIRISRGKKFFLYKFNIFDQRVINELRKKNVFIHTKDLEHEGKLIFIGKVLRQTYLDELPQLINVMRGEMSLVGPRPLNEQVYQAIMAARIPEQAVIPAGITGPFQSSKGKGQKSSAKLDAEYLREFSTRRGWSLVLYDIKIILRTIKVMLRAQGV